MVIGTKIMMHFSDHFKSAFAALIYVLFIHAMYHFLNCKQNTVINIAVVYWIRLSCMHIMFWTRFRTLYPLQFTPHSPPYYFSLLNLCILIFTDSTWGCLYMQRYRNNYWNICILTGLIFEINGLPFPQQPSFVNIF